MNLQDFIKLLRARWLTVCATTLAVVLAATAYTMLVTPMYQASTRLFVSTTSGASINELYQGNLYSQQRVLSYVELLEGETIAQRTIDKLGLDMSAKTLQQHVTATTKPDTVLIDLNVLDESPVKARDIANAMSDEFVRMARDLETPASGAAPDARVVVEQRASTPTTPTTPQKTRNLALGLALGLLLGVGIAFLRDYFDNTMKDRESLEKITSVGVVGSIPLDKERLTKPAISFEQDRSGIAEAFRKLRTNLQFLAVDDPPRVIVVASSLPSEGKSTTAINIALALAEAKHSVVLVDGDLRHPMLDKYLNMVGAVGLSTVLSGGAALSEVLQKTPGADLSVLTSGPIPPNPSELLASLAAKKVFGELRATFDYVIVDSPPLLAVTDAAIMAASADGVLMVARFGRTKREQLAHAIKSIRDVDARLLGAVFTMTRGVGAYNYDYGYYGYGHDPDPMPASSASMPTVKRARLRHRKASHVTAPH